jgi:hypothetical protein
MLFKMLMVDINLQNLAKENQRFYGKSTQTHKSSINQGGSCNLL